MFDRCMKQSKEKAFELVDKLGVKLTSEDKEHHEKQLMKVNATAFLVCIMMGNNYCSELCIVDA